MPVLYALGAIHPCTQSTGFCALFDNTMVQLKSNSSEVGVKIEQTFAASETTSQATANGLAAIESVLNSLGVVTAMGAEISVAVHQQSTTKDEIAKQVRLIADKAQETDTIVEDGQAFMLGLKDDINNMQQLLARFGGQERR